MTTKQFVDTKSGANAKNANNKFSKANKPNNKRTSKIRLSENGRTK